MTNEPETVRLQVPMPEYVAQEITDHAKGMDRSTAWLTVQLLEFMVEDRKRVLDWFGAAIFGGAYGTVKRLLSGRRRPKGSKKKEVRVQVTIPAPLLHEIEQLAGRMQQTPVRMAGMLIEAGVHHHEPFMDFVESRFFRRLVKRRRGGGGGTETTKDMRPSGAS